MKKLIFAGLAAVLAMTVTTIHAQDIPERKRDGHRMHSPMQKLDLSEAQQQKLKAVNEDFRKKAMELRKQDDITVKESRTRMEALRKDHQASVQGLLTAEQKTKLEQMKKEGKQGGKEFRKQGGMKGKKEFGRRGQVNHDKLKSELGLTDEQAAKMKASREEMMKKMKAVRDDESLSSDARKEKMKALKEEHKTQMKKVLTAEQLKKLEKN